MSNTLDISMDQGSSLTYAFTLKNTDNSPFNLTGFDARLQVRKAYGDSVPQIDCSITNGKLILTSAVGGVLTLKLAASDTSPIRFAARDDDVLECVYDLEVVAGDGTVFKPARGTFSLNREVTR